MLIQAIGWYITNIEIRICHSYSDPAFVGQQVIIRSISVFFY